MAKVWNCEKYFIRTEMKTNWIPTQPGACGGVAALRDTKTKSDKMNANCQIY